MTCKTCDRYEQMGFGQQCPCTHINGKCQSETLTSQLPDVTRFLTNRRTMKTVYAIRDRVADDLAGVQQYTLFTYKTDQQAARYFADAVLDKQSILNKHPADYELIVCGAVEDNGTLHPLQEPKVLITGDALIATHQQQAQANDS